jgi:transposase
VSSSRKKVTVLKAVTHDGETLHFWTEETLTADHGVRLLGALRAKFGKKLVVLLDQASYFYAKDLWEFVSGDRSTACVGDTTVKCVRGDALQVWYFPPHLPELNPVEGCWNQLNNWFKYRLIEDLSELKAVLATALDEIPVPDIFNYLCPDGRPDEISKDF